MLPIFQSFQIQFVIKASMRIQLYNIVSVDQYVNRMISDFLSFSSDLQQGDILIADKINKLLEKSRYMLKNIDNFMNKNCLDPRVTYLYVTRNKLFKFIEKVKSNKLVNQLNSISNSQNQPLFNRSPTQSQPQTLPRQILPNKKSTIKVQDSQLKNKQNELSHQIQSENINPFSHLQRKQTSFYQNKTKPDPIKIQPESPVFLKARTPSTKAKPLKQDQKLVGQTKRPKQNQNINPGIKTSKKFESFTPVKSSSSKLVNENLKGMKGLREVNEKGKEGAVFEKSERNKNFTPESRRTKKTERTPTKGTGDKQKITQSHLYNEYNNGSGSKMKGGKGEEPSSAIKNLSNLIFTIKMTREEYNEFRKIKEEHERKPSMG